MCLPHQIPVQRHALHNDVNGRCSNPSPYLTGSASLDRWFWNAFTYLHMGLLVRVCLQHSQVSFSHLNLPQTIATMYSWIVDLELTHVHDSFSTKLCPFPAIHLQTLQVAIHFASGVRLMIWEAGWASMGHDARFEHVYLTHPYFLEPGNRPDQANSGRPFQSTETFGRLFQ